MAVISVTFFFGDSSNFHLFHFITFLELVSTFLESSLETGNRETKVWEPRRRQKTRRWWWTNPRSRRWGTGIGWEGRLVGKQLLSQSWPNHNSLSCSWSRNTEQLPWGEERSCRKNWKISPISTRRTSPSIRTPSSTGWRRGGWSCWWPSSCTSCIQTHHKDDPRALFLQSWK